MDLAVHVTCCFKPRFLEIIISWSRYRCEFDFLCEMVVHCRHLVVLKNRNDGGLARPSQTVRSDVTPFCLPLWPRKRDEYCKLTSVDVCEPYSWVTTQEHRLQVYMQNVDGYSVLNPVLNGGFFPNFNLLPCGPSTIPPSLPSLGICGFLPSPTPTFFFVRKENFKKGILYYTDRTHLHGTLCLCFWPSSFFFVLFSWIK